MKNDDVDDENKIRASITSPPSEMDLKPHLMS